jgi:hypothetical protein
MRRHACLPKAKRLVQANCKTVEPGHWPLNGRITDGLFTALLVLGERAEALSRSFAADDESAS